MSLITSVAAASETVHVVNELPFPAPVFGAITLTIFVVLGFVTFSFRDVANRHSDKAEAYAREHGSETH
ncbi:hypothetical protein [Leucobacter chinensis]|uniref:hypothetical protein n=1 Tax=Leucobacter chinensis TaxID=2851010 RepID=UPI001C220082|nr:hypothetical protein [Leucobacter chinensis]